MLSMTTSRLDFLLPIIKSIAETMKNKKDPQNSIVLRPSAEISTEIAQEVDALRDLLDNSVSKNTKHAYKADWTIFTTWCESRGVCPLPADPETVSLYIAALSSGTIPGPDGKPLVRRASTINRHLSTISRKHAEQKMPSPTSTLEVKTARKGMRNKLGTKPDQKSPALAKHIRKMCDTLPDDEHKTRNRAILLIGFAGAFRRSEIVSLEIGDVDFQEKGAVILLRKSKTDQEGKGEYKFIPKSNPSDHCPVLALEAHIAQMAIAGYRSGALFRRHSKKTPWPRMRDKQIAFLLKDSASRIGLDPDVFSGHSLRAGFVTTAVIEGRSLYRIQEKTGHKSLAALALYIRNHGNWDEDVGKGLI